MKKPEKPKVKFAKYCKCIKCEKEAFVIGVGIGGTSNLCKRHFEELVTPIVKC